MPVYLISFWCSGWFLAHVAGLHITPGTHNSGRWGGSPCSLGGKISDSCACAPANFKRSDQRGQKKHKSCENVSEAPTQFHFTDHFTVLHLRKPPPCHVRSFYDDTPITFLQDLSCMICLVFRMYAGFFSRGMDTRTIQLGRIWLHKPSFACCFAQIFLLHASFHLNERTRRSEPLPDGFFFNGINYVDFVRCLHLPLFTHLYTYFTLIGSFMMITVFCLYVTNYACMWRITAGWHNNGISPRHGQVHGGISGSRECW